MIYLVMLDRIEHSWRYVCLLWEQRVVSSNPTAPTIYSTGQHLLVLARFAFLG
jgi:hypothetical protein